MCLDDSLNLAMEGPEWRKAVDKWFEENTFWGEIVQKRSLLTGETWEEHPLLPVTQPASPSSGEDPA